MPYDNLTPYEASRLFCRGDRGVERLTPVVTRSVVSRSDVTSWSAGPRSWSARTLCSLAGLATTRPEPAEVGPAEPRLFPLHDWPSSVDLSLDVFGDRLDQEASMAI